MRKNQTFEKLKACFSALSRKGRAAVAARAAAVLFILAVLCIMYKEFGVTENELFFSVVTLSGMAVFLPPVLFLFFFGLIFLLLLTDIHLFRAYGLSLSGFGEQIFAVVRDTNGAEVVEYLAGIGLLEGALLAGAGLCAVFICFYRPSFAKISGTKRRLICFSLCLMYPFTYAAHIYPLFQSGRAEETNALLSRARAFKFDPVKGGKADTVVVLIGESHRQAEFGPAFDQYASRFSTLYRFSDMISPHAGTLNAVPVILSRKKGTDTRAFFHERSLFSLFKEAGYATYFVHYVENYAENQLNFIYTEADHFIKYVKKMTPAADEGILTVLDGIFADRQKKRLIVIKMIGVHINFINRYPDPELSFFKRLTEEMKPRTKERETYHYNKAIAYSAGVVAEIMNKTEKRSEPSLLFFSSDHGFCIFDKGHFHLPPDCRNAFHIPAMILLNPALSAMTPQPVKDNLACNRDRPLTEEYDFETIASLAGIVHPTADRKYDLTKQCVPNQGKRVVSTGRERVFYEDL